MRIIQVTGRSNSGKTTFIRTLIPALNRLGKVGVIKHLAEHDFFLEEGKDTTGFFQAGAAISAGIDGHKSVAAIRNNSLDAMLALMKAQGMDFAILEGFKQQPYRKIVIGDLKVGGSLLTNPTIDEVIAAIHLFDEY